MWYLVMVWRELHHLNYIHHSLKFVTYTVIVVHEGALQYVNLVSSFCHYFSPSNYNLILRIPYLR